MNNTLPRYADWKAPDEDGQLLLWPDRSTLLRQTAENRRQLVASQTLIQQIPLNELRRNQRSAIGHTQDEQPLIATGHQTELYHAGVWVKDALASALANKLTGKAWHFAVDTDAPKHLHLRWPGGSMPITDDPQIASAAWSGLLKAPSAKHIDDLTSAIEAASQTWDFKPAMQPFLAGLKIEASENSSLANALNSAIARLDASLNLKHEFLLMSKVWGSESYLTFAHHLLARARDFAADYNAALRSYRQEQHITSPGRPMPDLDTAHDEIETPFWLDDLANQSRQRLTLQRASEGWSLPVSLFARNAAVSGSPEEFVFQENAAGEIAAKNLAAFLDRHHLRIAPRALPLTIFFRLFLADQFIHGIGGGRYDQVTDRIIASFFKIDPPSFAVTTATLYFPAASNQKRITLQPLKEEGRRLRHGAQWPEKRAIAGEIASLPRNSRRRRDLFFEMHARLNQEATSQQMKDWQQRLDQAAQQQSRQKLIFDRELFYALQPPGRLREMISRYDNALM